MSIRADGACAFASGYWCCSMPCDSGEIVGLEPCSCACHAWEVVTVACDHSAGLELPDGRFFCFGCDDAPADMPAREVAA